MMYGMIGLGMMGRAMATRLVEAGYDLVVYNRTLSKAERFAKQYPAHVQVASSPRELAEKSQWIFSVVTDDLAIEQIAGTGHDDHGLLSALGPQHIWVDSSTISPRLSRKMSDMVAQTGAVRLEAPVSGSVDAARAGTLLMFIGGSQDVMEHVRPALDHMAARIEWVGEVGQALALKLGMNLNLALQIEGFVEGMMIAESAGLPREKVIHFMLNSVIASPALKYRVPLSQNPPDEPWFTIKLMLKDLNLALEQANQHATAIPLTSMTADLLRLAVRHRVGDEDLAELINYMSARVGSPEGHMVRKGGNDK